MERRSSLRRCLRTLNPADSPMEFAMTQAELLQFEVIRMIAASLISLAIFLLCLVALSRQ